MAFAHIIGNSRYIFGGLRELPGNPSTGRQS